MCPAKIVHPHIQNSVVSENLWNCRFGTRSVALKDFMKLHIFNSGSIELWDCSFGIVWCQKNYVCGSIQRISRSVFSEEYGVQRVYGTTYLQRCGVERSYYGTAFIKYCSV
jgi:hypothetical protein